MMYFPDLTPYPNSKLEEIGGMPTLTIGWLEESRPYSTGETPQEFQKKLQDFCNLEHTVFNLPTSRGCASCKIRMDGEIRVIGKSVIYAAPAIVGHYVRGHHYKPPDEFIEAVLNGPSPTSEVHKALIESLVMEVKRTTVKDNISVTELEKRMRPDCYSRAGFLGQEESLEDVIRKDEHDLRTNGISCEQISAELEKLLKIVMEQTNKLSKTNFQEYLERAELSFNLYDQPEPVFSPDHLPDLKFGFLVENKYQVLLQQWRGLQDCPWDCQLGNFWSSFDFLLINRETAEYITAPGLIVHLIGEHHFFEGKESPYRVEPLQMARVLGFIT